MVELALSQHIKAVYKNSNSHKCDKYQESFNNIKHLKKHKVMTHEPNLFECADCKAMFAVKHSLRKHTKEVHTNTAAKQTKTEITFKCRMCEKGCNSGLDLDSHLAQCARNTLSRNVS